MNKQQILNLMKMAAANGDIAHYKKLEERLKRCCMT